MHLHNKVYKSLHQRTIFFQQKATIVPPLWGTLVCYFFSNKFITRFSDEASSQQVHHFKGLPTKVESEVYSVGCVSDKVPTFYFKLPYIGHYSGVTQKRIRHLLKRYCNKHDIKLFSLLLKSGACLAQKTLCLAISVLVLFTNFHVQAVTLVTSVKPPVTHFSTSVREHLATDRASHVYKLSYNILKVAAICVRPIVLVL